MRFGHTTSDASSEDSFLSVFSRAALIEQIKQQYRLFAAADASNYFELAVPHMMNHTIQIRISFNHYNRLVLGFCRRTGPDRENDTGNERFQYL